MDMIQRMQNAECRMQNCGRSNYRSIFHNRRGRRHNIGSAKFDDPETNGIGREIGGR